MAVPNGAPLEGDEVQPVERLSGVVYYSREQLEASPSRRDGISAAQEAEWRAEYSAIVSEAGMRLRIPQWAIYTAAQLCHRFYAVRSMARNDRYLIAAACLFLSAKLQEFPKRASDVATACDHVRFYPHYERAHRAWREQRGQQIQQQQQNQQQQQQQQQPHPQQPAALFAVGPGAPPPPPPSRAQAPAPQAEPPRWWEDRAHAQRHREELLVAERAVLFALNFALAAAAHPYAHLLRWVAELDWAARAARARREGSVGARVAALAAAGGVSGAAAEAPSESAAAATLAAAAAAARAARAEAAVEADAGGGAGGAAGGVEGLVCDAPAGGAGGRVEGKEAAEGGEAGRAKEKEAEAAAALPPAVAAPAPPAAGPTPAEAAAADAGAAAAMSRDVLHVAWSLVTDSARTQLALRHHPSKLAAAALYTAALLTGTLPLPPRAPPRDGGRGAAGAGGAGGGGTGGGGTGGGEGKGGGAGGGEGDGAERDDDGPASIVAFFRQYRLTAAELDDIATEMMDASDALCSGGGDTNNGDAGPRVAGAALALAERRRAAPSAAEAAAARDAKRAQAG